MSRDDRHLLLARIHRRFRTVDVPIDLGILKFIFTRIEDPNRILDEVAAEEDRLHRTTGQRPAADTLSLPYWAELWDSAMGIAQFLARQSEIRNPSSAILPDVLDLGCGMGLTGTVAAALGHQVTFADIESAPLLFARLNSLPWRDRVRTRQLNWKTGRLPARYGLILGADIVYERAQWQYLESFWRGHLAPGGTVLLGEPGRPAGDDFPAWIAARGWTIQIHAEPVETRASPIRLIHLRACGP